MTTKWTLLSIGLLLGLAVAPSRLGADAAPMIVTNLTGQLQIHQNIPCGSVNQTTNVTGGRLVIAPAGGVDVPGGKQFGLTRANISFAPFSISGSCYGYGSTRNYTALGVDLARAVVFTA